MTEPDHPGSNPAWMGTRAVLDGDHWVINGRKWFSSGFSNERCKVGIVMGKSDPDAPRHQQQSQILVPLDTPGVKIERALHVFGQAVW